jgi:hypothetical protein
MYFKIMYHIQQQINFTKELYQNKIFVKFLVKVILNILEISVSQFLKSKNFMLLNRY